MRGGKAFIFYGSSAGLPADHVPDEVYDSAEYEYTYPPPPRDVHEFRVEGLGYVVAKGGFHVNPDGLTWHNQIMGCPASDVDLDDSGTYYGSENSIGAAITTPSTQIFLPGEPPGAYSDYKWFGYALGNAGDVNGDGRPEAIVCALGRYSWIPPKIFLYLGNGYGYNFGWVYDWSVEDLPFSPRGYLEGNAAVGSAGDINGDGYGDIFVGDPTYNPDHTYGKDGRVHIWLGGPPTAEDPSGLGQSETPGTADIILDPSVVSPWPISCVSFGYSVASGDINGDGLSDIVVGDPYAFHPEGGTDPGVQSGAVHVFLSGFSPPAEAHIQIEHTYRGDLIVDIGVGNPSSPAWSQRIWNGDGGGLDNLDLTVDLSAATMYLPPSETDRWFLQVYDRYGGDTGQITEFTITHQGNTWGGALDVPEPINDFQIALTCIPGYWAYVYVEHTYRGDLIVDIGVGDPGSPDWSRRVWNGEGGDADNLELIVDLHDVSWPGPGTYNMWVRVYDRYMGDQGRIVAFTIKYWHHNPSYSSPDVPVPINDLETSYASVTISV